jgi:hypothetical protein
MQNKIRKKDFHGYHWSQKTKIQLLINPTKIQKTNGNNFIFKLQKATQLQVLKVECKKISQTWLSWLPLKLKN